MRGGLGCLVSFQRVLGGVGANREQMTCWVLLKGDLWERRDPIELLGVSGAPLLARPAVHRCGADRGELACLSPRSGDERRPRPGHVPVDTGTASVAAGLAQAALTSIVLGVVACGAGTLTSSMPLAYFASTWAALTPSGRAKFRSNAPYATSRTK